MHIELRFLVEQAKTLPFHFLTKEGNTTSVAIFCALVSVPLVQRTRAGCTTGVQLTGVSVPRGT